MTYDLSMWHQDDQATIDQTVVEQLDPQTPITLRNLKTSLVRLNLYPRNWRYDPLLSSVQRLAEARRIVVETVRPPRGWDSSVRDTMALRRAL